MAFDKPIVIIYEEEERFFSFDLHRWQNDLCVKAPLPPPDKDGAYAATVTDKEKKQGFRWASDACDVFKPTSNMTGPVPLTTTHASNKPQLVLVTFNSASNLAGPVLLTPGATFGISQASASDILPQIQHTPLSPSDDGMSDMPGPVCASDV